MNTQRQPQPGRIPAGRRQMNSMTLRSRKQVLALEPIQMKRRRPTEMQKLRQNSGSWGIRAKHAMFAAIREYNKIHHTNITISFENQKGILRHMGLRSRFPLQCFLNSRRINGWEYKINFASNKNGNYEVKMVQTLYSGLYRDPSSEDLYHFPDMGPDW